MKVFAFLVIVASVSAKGSGPYLPSGWRPDGPAFYLPSEVVKPLASSNPISELILSGSEASGSDSLLEYGPPAVSQNIGQKPSNPSSDLDGSEASGSDSLLEYGPPVLSEIINQGLPDAVTEQNFNLDINFAIFEASTSASPDQDIVQESVEQTTVVNVESPAAEENASEQVGAASAEVNADIETLVDVVTISPVESGEVAEPVANVESSELPEPVANVESSELPEPVANVESSELPEPVAQTTESVSQEVTNAIEAEQLAQNIPDIIASLENGITSQQVEVSSAVNDVTSNVAVSGSLEQAPEGFLEYGPPGFSEYGPPQGDVVVQGNSNSLQSIESNAVRRRRFSPKFRSSKKH